MYRGGVTNGIQETRKRNFKSFPKWGFLYDPACRSSRLLTSIAVIFGGTGVWDQTDTFWGVLRMIGQTGLQFIVPMISAYIAYSIADRPGLAPAFITG